MTILRHAAPTVLAALATLLVVGPWGAPRALQADDPTFGYLVPTEGTLTLDGVEVRADLDLDALAGGGAPVVRIRAQAPEARAWTGEVKVQVTLQTPARPTARMIPMPQEVLSETVALDLAEHATHELAVALEARPAPGSVLTVWLVRDDQRVLATQALVPAPQAEDLIPTLIEVVPTTEILTTPAEAAPADEAAGEAPSAVADDA